MCAPASMSSTKAIGYQACLDTLNKNGRTHCWEQRPPLCCQCQKMSALTAVTGQVWSHLIQELLVEAALHITDGLVPG
jgi:hypothetical protein